MMIKSVTHVPNYTLLRRGFKGEVERIKAKEDISLPKMQVDLH